MNRFYIKKEGGFIQNEKEIKNTHYNDGEMSDEEKEFYKRLNEERKRNKWLNVVRTDKYGNIIKFTDEHGNIIE